MKPKETVSILPQEESPSVRFCKDGKLLAVTLLLALLSCCLTVLSFCRVAALQAELGRLRAELRELPGAPQAGAAAPRAALREAAAATSALQGSLALPAPGESNSSQSSRSKRGLPDAEETGMFGAQKRLGARDPSSQSEELLPSRGKVQAGQNPESQCFENKVSIALPGISKTPTGTQATISMAATKLENEGWYMRAYTFVPWLLSFKRGRALEERENKILVKETGYFFIYGQVGSALMPLSLSNASHFVLTSDKVLWFVSQVLYTDNTFAMGHLIQRKKVHVFGDELSLVTLFRCIQNMPETLPNNSCYSAGK
ncbi:hypothetical protein J1605_009401 [Eschrichtius robustus]|uniref:THD domain-containing protein n=1 Tax=Eschrichtius robustus TaxID=9764 RepID=A0AB34GTB1_ESCRO|nr:hypothetical protein J1605_009401 [Eschrichtius robustus]